MVAEALNILDFLNAAKNNLIVDVRAPIEFDKGHIPNAVNVPLFNNLERAEIGTIFKQQGRELAIDRGKEIVSPKIQDFIKQIKNLSKNNKVFVYCFRGGMRSNSFAWLMNNSGLEAVIMAGGYKAFRNYVLNYFSNPLSIVLLGGKTGSGKTEILKVLTQQHIQVLDIEFHAHHKGSAFGTIHQKAQNPQQIFEHDLFWNIRELNPKRHILIEDESQAIGYNKIPHNLWLQMKSAVIIKLEIPFELRLQKLVDEYGTIDASILKASILKISQQLGTLNTKLCLQYIEDSNLIDAARIALIYYDKAYEHHYQKKQQQIIPLYSDTINPRVNAEKVSQLIKTLN